MQNNNIHCKSLSTRRFLAKKVVIIIYFIWKAFLSEKLSSRYLAQLITQDNATIPNILFRSNHYSIQLLYIQNDQNQAFI